MADYDLFHDYKPVLGTGTAVAMDGAHYTPAIDTLGWKALQFMANLTTAIAYNTAGLAWAMQESDDNSTFTAVDPSLVLFDLPLDPTVTSQVFHGSYIGKKEYVKAAFQGGGVTTVTPASAWLVSTSATAIASATAGNNVQTGTYTISVDMLSATPGTIVAETNVIGSGNGTVTPSTYGTATVLAPYFGRNFRAVCVAAATNAGTFDVFDPSGFQIAQVPVGATGATLKDAAGNSLFKLVIADGSTDWSLGEEVEVRITDLGVNRYKLVAPDATVVGYPFGKVPFTSSQLNFTIPDTTAVNGLTATTTIVVASTAPVGQITAMLGHPMSAPIWQTRDAATATGVAQ